MPLLCPLGPRQNRCVEHRVVRILQDRSETVLSLQPEVIIGGVPRRRGDYVAEARGCGIGVIGTMEVSQHLGATHGVAEKAPDQWTVSNTCFSLRINWNLDPDEREEIQLLI